MIKKLKKRLTLTTMSLVTIVLVLVFLGLFYSSYKSSVQETDAALEMALSKVSRPDGGKEEAMPGAPDEPLPQEPSEDASSAADPSGTDPSGADSSGGPEDPGLFDMGKGDGKGHASGSFTPTVVAKVGPDGSVSLLHSMMASVSDETLSEMVTAAQDTGSDAGYLRAYEVRFRIRQSEDGGTYIAFADFSSRLGALRSLLLSSLSIGVLALIVLYLISSWLSAQAVKPVQASMDQQKQFIADASHELKTPLTVIMTNTEIMMRHPQETVSSQRKWLESTQEEGTRMEQLISNLLFLAKSDAGRVPMTYLKVNLSDLIEGSVLTYEPVAFDKGIRIDAAVAPDITGSVDQAQIRQLVMILLDNAVKYSVPKGTVKISLAKTGENAVIRVNNMGEVISPEVIPHLFERFYRTDEARTHEETGGYGLGLSIAKSICELHHGSIACESTQEDGTTFTVTLPLEPNSRKKS